MLFKSPRQDLNLLLCDKSALFYQLNYKGIGSNVGVEPTSPLIKVRCSTVELIRHLYLISIPIVVS